MAQLHSARPICLSPPLSTPAHLLLRTGAGDALRAEAHAACALQLQPSLRGDPLHQTWMDSFRAVHLEADEADGRGSDFTRLDVVSSRVAQRVILVYTPRARWTWSSNVRPLLHSQTERLRLPLPVFRTPPGTPCRPQRTVPCARPCLLLLPLPAGRHDGSGHAPAGARHALRLHAAAQAPHGNHRNGRPWRGQGGD